MRAVDPAGPAVKRPVALITLALLVLAAALLLIPRLETALYPGGGEPAPIMLLELRGDYPLDELGTIAETGLRPRLEAVEGVAAVELSGVPGTVWNEETPRVFIGGQRVILIKVLGLSGSRETALRLGAALETLCAGLPGNLSLNPLWDTAALTGQILDELYLAAFLGFLLLLFVLILCLRNLRAAFLTSLAGVFSVLIVLAILAAGGISLNLISLWWPILGFGLGVSLSLGVQSRRGPSPKTPYRVLLDLILERRVLVLILALILLAAFLIPLPAARPAPQAPGDWISLDISLRPGAPAREIEATLREAERLVRREIRSYRELILISRPGGEPQGSLYLILPPPVEQLDSPAGAIAKLEPYSLDFPGARIGFRQDQRASPAMAMAAAPGGGAGERGFLIAAGVFLLFCLLAIRFESFADSLAVLCSLPLPVLAAFWVAGIAGQGLFPGNPGPALLPAAITLYNALSLSSASRVLRLKQGLLVPEALGEAAGARLRPLLAGGLALMAALLPLACFPGTALRTVLRRPGVLGALAGLLLSIPTGLFLTPVLSALFGAGKDPPPRRKRRRYL